MDAKKCDRCLAFYEHNVAKIQGYSALGIFVRLKGETQMKIDLCDSCLHQLDKWLDCKAIFVDKDESK